MVVGPGRRSPDGLGCYALHAQRLLGEFAGGEPRLVSATGAGQAGAPLVDEWAEAHLELPSGATGRARCSMTSARWDMSLRVLGTDGQAVIPDLLHQGDDRMMITSAAGERTERCGSATSYTYQLQAFIDAVRGGAPYPNGADDAVGTSSLIDDCYRAIGLGPRPAHATSPGR